MGLCLWKSLLCLRRANMRGWVIALFCCGTLGSDERRVPVVKMAKDQVFHRWREGKTLTEKWLRSPATLMLATDQQWSGSPRGRACSSTHWVTQIFGKRLSSWLWSLTLKLPVLQISVLLVVCDLLCLDRETTETQRRLSWHPATAQRANHGLCHEDAFYTGQLCLAEYVHFVMQDDHCLSFSGKPSGSMSKENSS